MIALDGNRRRAPAPISDIRARQADREPGRIDDLTFIAGLRTAPLAKLYPVPFQAAEWRWLAIDREVRRRVRPHVRQLLGLSRRMLAARKDTAPALFAVAPHAGILKAERVPCVECGAGIYATGKGPVSRRADGWRCWRCV